MAARLGEDGNRQALDHFVTSSSWDAAHVRARLTWRMQPVIKPTALVIDDTGFLEDGDASACVTRQYTGTAGKVTNWQAGVALHLASDGASAAVNWRLFLPESWDPALLKADPVKVARRDACAIPAEVGHVEKWQLALDMIDETRSWGIEVPQVIADGAYGDTAAFRLLEERGLDYVVGISTTTTAQPEDAQPCTRAYTGRWRRPVSAQPELAQRVKSLVIAAGKSSARPVQWRKDHGRAAASADSSACTRGSWPCGSGPPDVRSARHSRHRASGPLAAGRMASRPGRARAVLALQPARIHPAARPRAPAKRRWRIENDYREMKQALGLAHFEGRTWPAGTTTSPSPQSPTPSAPCSD
ncbi:IS701 family transposase [Streptomyces sp. NPDC087901]|uniref:IS701 family transposase n=1 Tax=Streptomyces sp. NPDC087901 TaxID=3365818 RepID=UPI003805359E